MKELDKTKKYDLSKLTDEQFKTLLTSVGYGERLEYINRNCLYYNEDAKEWVSSVPYLKTNACATELFEDKKSNAVTQYERMEMKENNKPMTEEEKELWLFVYKGNVNYSFVNPKEKADQAVKDFREALKM